MTLTYYSTAPTLLANLYTALVARAGLASVTVSYGPVLGAPREFVVLADVTSNEDFAALGHLAKEEGYTLTIYVSVLREGNQQQTCTERAYAIAAEVEDYLRGDPTVGGAVRIAQVTRKDYEPFAGDSARQSILTLSVECSAQI